MDYHNPVKCNCQIVCLKYFLCGVIQGLTSMVAFVKKTAGKKGLRLNKEKHPHDGFFRNPRCA